MIDEVHGERQLPLLWSLAESGSCLPAKCLLPALPVLSRTLIIIFGCFSLPPWPHWRSSTPYKSIVLLVLTREQIFRCNDCALSLLNQQPTKCVCVSVCKCMLGNCIDDLRKLFKRKLMSLKSTANFSL